MGTIVESICCIKKNDIYNDPNYYSSFPDEKKNKSLNLYDRQKLPSEEINLSTSRLDSDINFSYQKNLTVSKFPINSKAVIVKKKGNPLEYYDVLKTLGEGTFGVVFKVKNKETGAIRAMKSIKSKNISWDNNEIQQEIEVLKKLNNPYIIKLFEFFNDDENNIYLIEELGLEGDLQTKLAKMKVFPEFIVKILMKQIFQAVEYLSQKKIIHGDLKLENILIDYYEKKVEEKKNSKKNGDNFLSAIIHDMTLVNTGKEEGGTYVYKKLGKEKIEEINRKTNKKINPENTTIFSSTNFKFNKNKSVNSENNINENIYTSEKLKIYNYGLKLTDFGCSKMFTKTKNTFHDVVGTLVYCAPEVLQSNYNEQCDIWSCGVIMYLLLSGKFPFWGENEDEIQNKILNCDYNFDDEIFDNISDDAKNLIKKCLIYDPEKRITVSEALQHKFFNELKQTKLKKDDINFLNNLQTFPKRSKFYQLVVTYLAYNFGDKHLLNEIGKIFNKIDINSDGTLTKDELLKAYKELGMDADKEKINEIINSIDFDKNGYIEYEEFIRVCIPPDQLFTEQNLKNAFEMFDTNKKGFITYKDIVNNGLHVDNTFGQKFIEKLKEDILNKGDGDEILEFDEFMENMKNNVLE